MSKSLNLHKDEHGDFNDNKGNGDIFLIDIGENLLWESFQVDTHDKTWYEIYDGMNYIA